MADDQNWSSQRAQDFWHNINAARTHGEPLKHRWGSLSDDNSSSTASRSEDGECGMPGDFVPGSELKEFVPYPSKTVSSYPPVSRENKLTSTTQMFILDLLNSMLQLRLSGEVMRMILWALRELDVPNIPSFHQFHNTQKALSWQIQINPLIHESVMGNIFHQNSPKDLLALVSRPLNFPSQFHLPTLHAGLG